MSKRTDTKSRNTLSKREQIGLRFALLRMWAFKNIKILFLVFFIICMGLAFSGIITKETPVLGFLFGDLSEEVRKIIEEMGGNHTIYATIESILALGLTIILCTFKLKRLGLPDITSKKCKVLLIRAGLYFDENGKLTKRSKTAKKSKVKVDSDGLIKTETKKEEKTENEESLFESVKKSGEELITIVTLDLDKVEKESKEEIYKSIELGDADNTIDLIKEDLEKNKKSLFSEDDVVDKKVSKKNAVKTFFKDLLSMLNPLPDKEDRIENAKERKRRKELEAAEKLAKEQEKQKAMLLAIEEKERKEQNTSLEKIKLKKIETNIEKIKETVGDAINTQQTVLNKGNAQSQLSQLIKNNKK